MRVLSILSLVLLGVVGTLAIFDMPVFNQCDEAWKHVSTPYGGSMCEQGSFVTSLAMALKGSRVSSDLSSARVPETNPEILSNYISSINANLLQHDEVHPELVELISPYVYHAGAMTLKQACARIIENDSFFLVTSTTGGKRSVSVLAICVEGRAIHHHPTEGRALLDASSVITVNEFAVAFNKRDALALKMGTPFLSEVDSGLTTIPFNYTMYFNQCNTRWKNDMISTKTVCEVGCLMSSVSAALYNHGLKLRNKDQGTTLLDPTPGTFNKFLKENGGYSGNLFIHGSIVKVCTSGSPTPCKNKVPTDSQHKADLTPATVQKYLTSFRVMVANVKNGGHWVLAVGWDQTNVDHIMTRDSSPAPRAWYSINTDIVGWRIYDIWGPKSPFAKPTATLVTDTTIDSDASDLARPSYEDIAAAADGTVTVQPPHGLTWEELAQMVGL